MTVNMKNNCHLHNRQTNTVDLLIDVEGVDVGHTADIIDDCHEACLDVGVVNVVLAAYTVN